MRKIKSFRLLKLLPSLDPIAPIECVLLGQSMEEPVLIYCALSYTWGSAHRKEEIILNGSTCICHLKLAPNRCGNFVTYQASSEACSKRNIYGSTLSASINKKNNEKRWKVRFMRDIFANADMVVVWLGPNSNGSGFVLDALSAGKDGPNFHSITRSVLMSFLNWPWWSQVRIVQEFMVAPQLYFLWALPGPPHIPSLEA